MSRRGGCARAIVPRQGPGDGRVFWYRGGIAGRVARRMRALGFLPRARLKNLVFGELL